MAREEIWAPAESGEDPPPPYEEETTPAPAAPVPTLQEIRLRRGSSWPPAVALLNLTGLGLGYLWLQRRVRWAIHLLLTVGLVVAAYMAQAAKAPLLWIALFGLWLLWMTFDGWRQARRLAGPAGRRGLALTLTVLVLVVEAGGLGTYVALGQKTFTDGMAAYQSQDCRTAMQRFNTVTTLYELTLSPNVTAADAKTAECSLLLFAENSRREGEYAETTRAYRAYLDLYPESPLAPSVRNRLAECYADWAASLREMGDHPGAAEKYLIVLSDFSHTPAAEQAALRIAETYAEWATGRGEQGDFEGAIALYRIVLSDYPDTPAGEQAGAAIADLYARWAASLHQEEKFEAALEKYWTILNQYGQAPVAAEAREAAAQIYADWAAALRQDQEYENAIANYQTILTGYPDTVAARGVEGQIATTYAEWGRNLIQQRSFPAAIGKYQIILSQYPESAVARGAPAGIAEAYIGWGAQLRSGRHYISAIEKFTLAQEASDDPDLIAAAEEGYAQALWDLSQDTTGEGRQVLEEARAEVCAGNAATSPAVGLAAEKEPGRALLCGIYYEITLPNDLTAVKPAHFLYAVSVETGYSTIERCEYTQLGCIGWSCPTTHILVRQQEWWRVTVRNARTGQVAAQHTFYGTYPSYCPDRRGFAFYEEYISGGSPSSANVEAWLRGVLR